ncbi:hypothetical protein [Streptomyces sp. NPDC050988]|uniref:hypothetical protein n=1 Tax=Streptomyces sp. NPDC050988 TaxID=3365637 RepID=UPI0037B70ED6
MTEKPKDTDVKPYDNSPPSPPASEETFTTLDNSPPSPPANGGDATTQDNSPPSPPANEKPVKPLDDGASG